MKHQIDHEKISKNALSVISQLNKEGFEAYLVGGCIRDLLSKSVPKDFDISTDAHPQDIRKLPQHPLGLLWDEVLPSPP